MQVNVTFCAGLGICKQLLYIAELFIRVLSEANSKLKSTSFTFPMVVIILFTGCSRVTDAVSVPGFETPGWIEHGYPGPQGPLWIAQLEDDPSVLFLKLDQSNRICRYDTRSREMTEARLSDWKLVAGFARECGQVDTKSLSMVRINQKTNKLEVNGKEVETVGMTNLRHGFSPSGEKIAVLSAAGPKFHGVLPFFGGKSAFGSRFHQAFRLPDGETLGKTVILPYGGVSESVGVVCWSPDEKFVVYATLLHAELSIVPVPGS
jgi:hypothetical protein